MTQSTFGALIRHDEGQFIKVIHGPLLSLDPTLAEALGLQITLQWLLANGVEDLDIESDSQ